MLKVIGERLKESALSIGPFFLIILLIHFSGLLMIGSSDSDTAGKIYSNTLFDVDFYAKNYATYAFSPTLVLFLLAYPLMVIGMSFYGLGADTAIDKMGTAVGTSLTKKKSILLLFIVSALLGALCTFAEPDLTVFSTQLMGEGGKYVLIILISVGVGLFLGLAFIRIIFQWNYKTIVYIIFAISFGLGCLINKDSFFPIIYDGTGVTIGSMTVPFVLAMGIAVAQMRGSKNAEDDSFGLTGLAGLGPMIIVSIWAKIVEMTNMKVDFGGMIAGAEKLGAGQYSEIINYYHEATLDSLQDVGIAILPLIGFFVVYDLIFLHLNKKDLLKIGIGILETFVGLTIFMIGINSGFMLVARQMGSAFASEGFQNNFYVVMLLCLAMGILIILAEPGIHVLGKQVEEVSRGSIKTKELYFALCIGVSLSLIFGIARIQFLWELKWIVIPMLLIFIFLSLFVPKIYTPLSLDSAGIASSTMASAFLLPMAISFASAKLGTSDSEVLVQYGTGMVGLVFMCPLLSIECLGVYGKVKEQVVYNINKKRIMEPDDSQVIHLPNGEYQDVNYIPHPIEGGNL